MRLAIMQPYFFPYAGYFKLIAAVDKFVFYDDVNFIKGGWINRNRLLLDGAIRYMTVPLSSPSPFKKIRDIDVVPRETWYRGLREAIRHSYGKAPYYDAAIAIFDEATQGKDIGQLAKRSIKLVARYLEFSCEFVDTSSRYDNANLAGKDRVIDICQREQAACYVNLPGGRALYDAEDFAAHGIALEFVEGVAPAYARGSQAAVAGLSILDALMYHPPCDIRAMLIDGVVR